MKINKSGISKQAWDTELNVTWTAGAISISFRKVTKNLIDFSGE